MSSSAADSTAGRRPMEIRSFAELTSPDERTLRFTGLGLAIGGLLSPEEASEFQQTSVASAELVDAVPAKVRASFDRLRNFHSYGVICYDLFTMTDDLTWIVLEQALRERFVQFYNGKIPLIDRNGKSDSVSAPSFEWIAKAVRRGGSHAEGWHLRLEKAAEIAVPLTLAPLLRWARRVGLLDGQRNRRVQLTVYPELRNHFAHGEGFGHTGMPNASARSIHDLAEVINRLWGARTPGGRIYPGPLGRVPVVVAWSPGWSDGVVGSTLTFMRPDQLTDNANDDRTYLVVLAAEREQELREFDSRYELTTFPSEFLWGPGTGSDVIEWLAASTPTGDQVDYLDRLFAVRHSGGKVSLPYRPEKLLSIPADRRSGRWSLLRADFPIDALSHVRHNNRGEGCPDLEYGGCPVELVAEGSWSDVVDAAKRDNPLLQAADWRDATVPRRWPIAADLRY